MDEGRGYTYMDRPHWMVTPLVPTMLWGLLQISRSFALMNASMIACMLGSFPFIYLVLKEYTGWRMALTLTAVSALTYWQFRLATVIMTDQPFLLLFWVGMYFLVLGRRQRQRRWLWLSLAATTLLVGVGVRIASVLLIPTIGLGLWLDYRRELSLWRRALLVAAVTGPLVLAGAAYAAVATPQVLGQPAGAGVGAGAETVSGIAARAKPEGDHRLRAAGTNPCGGGVPLARRDGPMDGGVPGGAEPGDILASRPGPGGDSGDCDRDRGLGGGVGATACR